VIPVSRGRIRAIVIRRYSSIRSKGSTLTEFSRKEFLTLAGIGGVVHQEWAVPVVRA